MLVEDLKSGFARASTAVSAIILSVAVMAMSSSGALAQAAAPSIAAATAAAVPAAPIAAPKRDLGDMFAKLPCSAPKALARVDGVLGRTSRRLALNEPVTILALGSSSTAGAGASAPEFSYPSRLAQELARRFPKASINVVNRGVNGEDAADQLARLDTVLAEKPDLVIWQFGVNALLRDVGAEATSSMAEQGIKRLKAAGIDVLLLDPQFAPKVIAKSTVKEMVGMFNAIARRAHVPVFKRFAVMQHWHESQSMEFDRFVTADGLHMNDWGYSCLARVLGDSLADSVANAQTLANAAAVDPY
jgi:acyl-CoA thioesterase I